MASNKSSLNFFVLLLSGTGLIVILSLFLSAKFDLRSLAKEGGVRRFKMKVGESAMVYCSGSSLNPVDNVNGSAWVCWGEEWVDGNKPKPGSDNRIVYLQEGQTVLLDCPERLDIVATAAAVDNEFMVYCNNEDLSPTPLLTPSSGL